MIIFSIVKEPYGWAVRRDAQMMMPACSRDLAVDEAERMVAVLRRDGQLAQLRFESEASLEQAA